MSFSDSFNLASGSLLWNEECWHLPFVGREHAPLWRAKGYFYMYPLRQTRTLPGACTIVSSLLLSCLCIPSLLWLATVWICPLELREGQGGQTEKLLCPGTPQGPARFHFHSPITVDKDIDSGMLLKDSPFDLIHVKLFWVLFLTGTCPWALSWVPLAQL